MIQLAEWWLFLLAGPVVYWLLPAHIRTWALGLGSLALLAGFVGPDLLIMVVLAGLVFLLARLDPKLSRMRGWIAGSTALTWAVLLYFVVFKYLPSLAHVFSGQGSVGDVLVPIGISYFSFKLIHYTIEMRRGNFPGHGFSDFVSWMFLAPIFTAGPIERFEHYLNQREVAEFEMRFLVEGGLRIAQGLVKKFFFGVIVLELIQQVSGGGVLDLLNQLEAASPLMVWATLLLTLLYVYLDFSAYSDIAIGSSRLFGLRIMENFNFPMFATSLQLFWQRWHMTLANWCRSYIYMSMIGITRNPYAAVIATFLVMGAWHALSPHWIAWGLWHGLGLCWLLYWQRFGQKKKILLKQQSWGWLPGGALTIGYVSLGGAFTMLHGRAPITDSVRLIAKCFWINL